MKSTGDHKIWQVIVASSVGTMIEWYDFYIFGSLATVISPLFYPKGNDTLALIAYLSTFAVGFVVRPFGALFFGRLGDLAGRKYGRDGSRGVREAIGCGASGECTPELLRTQLLVRNLRAAERRRHRIHFYEQSV
jgi:hypothetical protein